MKRVIMIACAIIPLFSLPAMANEKTLLLMEKNRQQEALELQATADLKKTSILQAASLPTAPPAGVTYHTLNLFGDTARMCLWLSDNHLYLYSEPLTAEFFMCSGSFSVRQNNVLYDDVKLVTAGGNSLCQDLTQPVVVEFTCWSLADSCFDINQSFTVYFDGDYEQTFTFSPTSTQQSFSYYVPYFTSQSGHWTGLAVSNSHTSQAATISVTIYDKSGNILATESKTIAAMGQDAWAPGQGTSSEGWLHINSNQKLTGLTFVGTVGTGNYMADIPFSQEPEKILHIPHVAQNAEWDTTIFVCNPTSLSQTLKITYYDKQGEHQTPYTATIPAHSSTAYPLSNIISGQGDNGKVVIESSQGVVAFALYANTKIGGKCYTGINAVAPD